MMPEYTQTEIEDAERARDARIERLRMDLSSTIAGLLSQTVVARVTLAQLVADDTYDVGFAEGAQGRILADQIELIYDSLVMADALFAKAAED